jgi:hypothetical protein
LIFHPICIPFATFGTPSYNGWQYASNSQDGSVHHAAVVDDAQIHVDIAPGPSREADAIDQGFPVCIAYCSSWLR